MEFVKEMCIAAYLAVPLRKGQQLSLQLKQLGTLPDINIEKVF